LGTQVVEWITGLVFSPIIPDLLGAFIVFAAISYLGQLALYAAFRHWAEPHQLKPFAILMFFLPTFVFWPSSVGKDAIIVFGLGLAAYCVARVLERYEVRWLVALSIALLGISTIRVHISGLVIGSLLGAALVAKSARNRGSGVALRRFLVAVTSAVIAVAALTVFQERTGFSLNSSEDVTDFSDEFVRRTSGGGTVAAGEPVGGPEDIPGAVLLALFRPFLWESAEFQVLFSAVETTFLLLLVVWKIPAIVRNRRQWRANPLIAFSIAYILAYSVAFSVIRNLGIIARQRAQVLAFLLMIVVALGWEESRRPSKRGVVVATDEEVRSARTVVTVGHRPLGQTTNSG
jgi:hypothetical protein